MKNMEWKDNDLLFFFIPILSIDIRVHDLKTPAHSYRIHILFILCTNIHITDLFQWLNWFRWRIKNIRSNRALFFSCTVAAEILPFRFIYWETWLSFLGSSQRDSITKNNNNNNIGIRKTVKCSQYNSKRQIIKEIRPITILCT